MEPNETPTSGLPIGRRVALEWPGNVVSVWRESEPAGWCREQLKGLLHLSAEEFVKRAEAKNA